MGKKKRELRNLIIYPQFQIRFVMYMIAAVFGTLVVVYIANVYFIQSLISFGKAMGLPSEHPFFLLISDQQHTLNQVFLIAGFVSVLGWSIVSLLLSHRIAAPLTRLLKSMKAAGQGAQVAELKFRQGDYFSELASAFNSMLKR